MCLISAKNKNKKISCKCTFNSPPESFGRLWYCMLYIKNSIKVLNRYFIAQCQPLEIEEFTLVKDYVLRQCIYQSFFIYTSKYLGCNFLPSWLYWEIDFLEKCHSFPRRSTENSVTCEGGWRAVPGTWGQRGPTGSSSGSLCSSQLKRYKMSLTLAKMHSWALTD